MDLQKVKEALVRCDESIGENLQKWAYKNEQSLYDALMSVREAIVEISNRPDDDAGICAESCISIWLSESTDRRNDTAGIIQQYAESYHAKKCAECKAFPENQNCETCTGNGMQMIYPSQCTGCLADQNKRANYKENKNV